MNIYPDILDEKQQLIQRQLVDLQHPLKPSIEKLLICSEFANRYLKLLIRLIKQDDCLLEKQRQDFFSEISLLDTSDRLKFTAVLREYRNMALLRLLIREIAGLNDTQQTMSAWSDCADALILKVLHYCENELKVRYGMPLDDMQQPVLGWVLGMGKLGGRELNFSSDIDLIFCYSASGYTQGPESISNEEFFTKLVRLFVQIMQTQTPEGFVFRVDTRLRPNGESGALASSLMMLETYYQEQGRDWERYAMSKARIITENLMQVPEWYERLIIPFIYRRYVDFGVIDSLRGMKALIAREVQLNPRLDDIKRGKGGIREIEFVIQNMQLIRGGRVAVLRCQNALQALVSMRELHLLNRTEVLKNAYFFLRKLENYLQAYNDQQTHQLPNQPLAQAQIAALMNFPSWQALAQKLTAYQKVVNTIFRHSLGKTDTTEEKLLLDKQLAGVWLGQVESSMAINLLSSFGFEAAERCYQILQSLRNSPRCRRMTQASRIRLDRLMPLLLKELIDIPNSESVMLQALRLLDNIIGRSAYLALLSENLSVLREVLYWFKHSPFISNLLINYPFLLQILLDNTRNWRPPSFKELKKNLREALSLITDIEQQEELLRQYKLSYWLLTARAEMDRVIDTVKASHFLADLAEVILIEVADLACKQLASRFPEIKGIEKHFSLIVYGKLGSQEMNFSSDLDIVFIYQASVGQEALVNRLTQKIIHHLTARTSSGQLYAVDTRLRPSGAAGLLVSSWAAFCEYQQNQAWIWEYQALTRSRMVYGPLALRKKFQILKEKVLTQELPSERLKNEIIAMRDKMVKHRGISEPIKQSKGGLIDLEFIVQFLLLNHPHALFFSQSNTQKLIKLLAKVKVITTLQEKQLLEAYAAYHQALHHQLLRGEKTDDVSKHFFVINELRKLFL